MRLDKTRISIRERPFVEILDLSLRVARRYAGPLTLCWVLGVAPCCLANFWLLHAAGMSVEQEDLVEPDRVAGNVNATILLTVWQVPLATALMTLYLGQALFEDRINLRRLATDWLRSLPQLLVLQLALRSVLVLVCLFWPVPYCVWPYLNEVLLLERNALFSSRRTGVTTMRRALALHGRNTGELFGRWLGSMAIAGAAATASWVVLTGLWSLLYGQWEWTSAGAQSWLFPVALWCSAGFLTIVRYLCYLDLRIRNEGWEIELQMRAAGARLGGQFA